MDDPQQVSPRARLQQLLSIPERQRTDAQWDELNELEIMLAAGNREGAPHQGMRDNRNMSGGNPNKPGGGGGGGGGGPHRGRKQQRKFHQRPPRRNGP